MVLAVGFVLFAVACGDDDDGSASPSPDPQRTVLEAMVLQENEVPASLIELNRSFTTNEQSAEGTSDKEGTLERYNTWGRQLGLSVSFVLAPDADPPITFLAVRSDATLYEDAQGCHLSWQYDVDRAREADWESSFPEITDVDVVELDASEIGEEAYWLRVVGVTVDEPKTLMAIDQVVIRVGNTRAFLRADSDFNLDSPRDAGQGQVLLWAQVMASRMAERPAG